MNNEQKYLNLIQKVLDEGVEKEDRTGTGTISLFNQNVEYEIEQVSPNQYKIPFFTTKTLYFKGIVTELLWFLSGNTDTTILREQGNHIWDGNTKKETLEIKGLNYPEWELGPGYGYQWIHWGGNWKAKGQSEGGINQIKKIIEMVKEDPFSRRMVLSAWNSSDIEAMALPPCHVMYIFSCSCNIKGERTLNCHLTMRSNDMFLGHPFNVVSASLLLILICKCTNILPGKVGISMVDCHIYKNHVDQCKLQLTREPYNGPILTINKEMSEYEDFLTLQYEDFKLSDYVSHPTIKAQMAI